jgi:hypothetical protein
MRDPFVGTPKGYRMLAKGVNGQGRIVAERPLLFLLDGKQFCARCTGRYRLLTATPSAVDREQRRSRRAWRKIVNKRLGGSK